MYGFEIVDITFGFNVIMGQMLDHRGFCELEIVDFTFGFITILEQLEEAMTKSTRIRTPM